MAFVFDIRWEYTKAIKLPLALCMRSKKCDTFYVININEG